MQPRENPPQSLLETHTGRAGIRDQILHGQYHKIIELRSIPSLVAQGKFVEAIQQLHLAKDASEGIHSFYVHPIDHPEHTVLIRDARDTRVQEAAPKDSYHNWAIMGLNYAHAAKKLVEAHEGKLEGTQASSELHTQVISFLRNIESKSSSDAEKEFQQFVNSLVPILHPLLKKTLPEITKKDIREQLAEVRDFCNFEHDTMSVATRMSVPDEKGNRDIFQIDIPMCGNMPDDLKEEYQALADLEKCKRDIDKLASETNPKDSTKKQKLLVEHTILTRKVGKISWYKDTPPHIQYLIRYYAKHILAGKMIPTQLRKYFPGLRNTGEEFLVDAKSGEVIQHHYHSGTPGHLLGDATQSQTATTQSLAQLKKLTGAKHVLALTLLSPGNPRSDDSALVNQVENAVAKNNEEVVGEEQFHTCNIPLNPMRYLNGISRFVANRMGGAEWLESEAWEAKKLLRSVRENKENIQDTLDFKLGIVLDEYKALKSGSGLTDPENRNLQLVSVITRMAHLINEAHKADDPGNEKEFVAIQISCQSGKDRAGLSRLQTILDALKRFINSPSHQEESITEAVIKTQQIGLQAGLAGGTIGAGGLKDDTKRALPFSLKQYMNDLFKRTASYNKKLPKKSGKQTKRPDKTFRSVEQPEPVAVKVEDKQEEKESAMITIPFPPSYFLAFCAQTPPDTRDDPRPLLAKLSKPIVYTPETVKEVLTAVDDDGHNALRDLPRKSWKTTNKDVVPFTLRLPEDQELDKQGKLDEYVKQLCDRIKDSEPDEAKALDEAKTLLALSCGVGEKLLQGGVLNAGSTIILPYIFQPHIIGRKTLSTSTITRNLDGFTVESVLKPKSSNLFNNEGMLESELKEPPFEYTETYTLKKNAENHWELTLSPENSLKMHPKVWTHLLQQTHHKLQRPEFSDNDLFAFVPFFKDKHFAQIFQQCTLNKIPPKKCKVLLELITKYYAEKQPQHLHKLVAKIKKIQKQKESKILEADKKLKQSKILNQDLPVFIPCLIDKDFTEKFQKNLPKVPQEIRETLLVLIKNYYGKKENQPEHVKNLVTRINVLQNHWEKMKAPPERLQVVQPDQSSKAEPLHEKTNSGQTPQKK